MKYLLRALILMTLSLLLASCSIQSVEQHDRMSNEERSVEHQETTQDELAINDELDKVHEDDSVQKGAAKEEEAVSKDNPAATHSVQSNEEQEGQPETPLPTVTNEVQQQVKPTSKPGVKPSTKPSPKPTSKPAEQEPIKKEKRYVTIAIHAETLLKNWDLLDSELQDEKYVPKDGVILKATKYELLTDDESVWDVLLRATKEHKIQLEYQGASKNIYKSVYVEGINHLYEFSAGELSGWMYQVNGTYPNYGCGQYVLKDGDVIKWHYTVDLGRDLGAGM
ncbi:hypothetical protein FHS15_002319 [Paenibacillus castaneae]|uniref:DUF4430 domain-containing protein n=1 Tax=Paenibacillus castaneae TaxID=474957 RepID=UPI001FBAC568|nr:DUF4430 domain-containing protein [Paenibacillus castaneae]NIK77194.1 hypothetical protein [Paenibacillus castaneae]